MDHFEISSQNNIFNDYEKEMINMFYSHLVAAEEDVKEGRVQDLEEAGDEILREMDDFEL